MLGVLIPNYQLSARNEPTRDLLFTPNAHLTNSQLAKDPAFWGIVLQQMNGLAGRDSSFVKLLL